MSIRLDVTMPAVRRPSVLAEVLESVQRNLFAQTVPEVFSTRLIVNVDPVGLGSVSEVLDVCRRYFGAEVIFNAPAERGSLNAALKWLWSRSGLSDIILYLEDDEVITRPINLERMFTTIRDWPTLAYLQIPCNSFDRPSNWSTHNFRHYDLCDHVHIRTGKYRMSLQPSLMRREFAQALGSLLTLNGGDPELQFQPPSRSLPAYLDQWDFATWAKSGDVHAVSDIGNNSRAAAGSTKVVDPNYGTTWGKLPPAEEPKAVGCDLYGVKCKMWLCPESAYVVKEASRGTWKKDMFSFLRKVLKPGMTFVDVGAYLGTTSLFPAALGCKVLAVDCDPIALEILRKNLRLNPTLAQMVCVEDAAVASFDGEMELRQWGAWGDSMSTTALPRENCKATRTVRAVTLQTLMDDLRWSRLDVLKLNAQGAEVSILEGAQDILRRDLPIIHCYYFPKIYRDQAEAMLTRIRVALSMYQNTCNEDGTPFNWDAALTAAHAGERDGRFVALPRPLGEM